MTYTQKYVAELFGTFLLTLIIISAAGSVVGGIVAAIALALIVYILGPISGGHVNPAITLAVWGAGNRNGSRMSGRDVGGYIISQLVGAVLALLVMMYVFQFNIVAGTLFFADFSMPQVAVLVAELIGSVIFGIGVGAVVLGRIPASLSGIVIGGSLLLGGIVANLNGALGLLNPAIALAVQPQGVLVYMAIAIIGVSLGVQLIKFLYQTSRGRVIEVIEVTEVVS